MPETFIEVECGDSLEVLRQVPDNFFDSCVTDPPYGLSFMGKAWDYDVPKVELWREVYRTLKPGAFLLAFFGTRTYHRGAVQIEDAGFEIRDQLGWMYGSGFPKSMDVSKAIDKDEGYWRGKSEGVLSDNGSMRGPNYVRTPKGDPITEEAKKWSGWGTALKPAWEPIVLARKPLIGTVAENVLTHGTGGLNIDGCRVEYQGEADKASATPQGRVTSKNSGSIAAEPDACRNESRVEFERPELKGRFPANVIHDGSEDIVQVLGDSSRFFYCPKASKSERGKDNNHPTVKPVELMKYLCRLVTPPGGAVLDPFCGSGTTGIAAKAEGFSFVGIERDPNYVELARKRIG